MKKAIIAMLCMAAFVACEKDEPTPEKKEKTLADCTLSFESTTEKNIEFEVGDTEDQSVELVVLLDNAAPADAEFSLAVSSASSAVEGTHYAVITNDLIIKKGEDQLAVEISILAAGLENGKSASLELSIESSTAKVEEESVTVNMKRLSPNAPEVLFSEDFESGQMPEGWQAINVSGETPNGSAFFSDISDTWVVTDLEAFMPHGTYCAGVASWTEKEVNDDDYLITSAVTLGSSNVLSFAAASTDANDDGNYVDNIKVYVSTSSDQSSFTDEAIYTEEGILKVDGGLKEVEVNIPAKYDGQVVYIAFRNDANAEGLALDDIKIMGIK